MPFEKFASNKNNSDFLGRNLANNGVAFSLQNVSVDYGGVLALRNIDLNITKGEIVFITGTSGAGKTTLLKILSREFLPTKGQALIPGVTNNLFISQVFQDLRLISNYTCQENLMFSYDSKIYQSKKEFIEEMNDLCRVLGIQNKLKHKIKNTNGGLKQKIAMARALLSRPDVVVADEPTSSLDSENARKIFEVLNLYNKKRGTTIVWASHNRELVKTFTGRIIHLDNGKLVYSGHACFI